MVDFDATLGVGLCQSLSHRIISFCIAFDRRNGRMHRINADPGGMGDRACHSFA